MSWTFLYYPFPYTLFVMETLQNIIDLLTDLSIDMEGEEECIVAGFRFELEDIKCNNSQKEVIMSAIEEFEKSWLNDIIDLVIRKEIGKAFTIYKNNSEMVK